MWSQIFPFLMLIIMLPAGIVISILPIYLIYKVIKKAIKDSNIETKGKVSKEEE